MAAPRLRQFGLATHSRYAFSSKRRLARGSAFLGAFALWGAVLAPAQELPKEAPPVPARDPAAELTSPAALREVLAIAPRRTKIGSMRSVRIHSDILFASDPDRPHELTFSAAFPKRSRLAVRPVAIPPKGPTAGGATDPSPTGLSERYQIGDAVFGRDVLAGAPPGASRSYAQTGPAAAETKLDFALRRCAFFWPDEGAFQGAGWSRTTQVDGLGVLLLRLDEGSGRPVEIRALGAGGQTVARLAAIKWQEIEGRAWPQSFEFWAGGSKIWTETVTAVEDEWFLGDPWFLPSDRVGDVIGKKNSERLRMRVRSASQVRLIPVTPPQSVDRAIRSAGEHWLSQWEDLAKGTTPGTEDQTGWLLPSAALVLGPEGGVVSIELEAAAPAPGTEPWPGWTRRKSTSEWAYLLDDPAAPKDEASLAKGVREGRALLEVTGTAALKHGPVRLRVELVDTGVGGLIGVQPRLTRAALETPPSNRTNLPQRR